jgi:hypothetical protein
MNKSVHGTFWLSVQENKRMGNASKIMIHFFMLKNFTII